MGVFCVSIPVAAMSDEVLSKDEGTIGTIRSPPNGTEPGLSSATQGPHRDGLPLPLEVHAAFLRFLPPWSRSLTGAPTP